MMINYSEIESKRFGINVFRAKLDYIDVVALEQEIRDSGVDVLILRLPNATKAEHSKLLTMGYQVLHADSLVYYSCSLQKVDIKKRCNRLIFELIDDSNISVLDSIIPIIFEGYQNHYYSNPIFDRVKINEGYVEWAKSYNCHSEGRIAWMVKDFDSGYVAAFATCSFDQDKKQCEGILYGVMPEFAGRGIYSDIIRFTQDYFKKLQYETMLVSTQLQNYAVQKVWIRDNFTLSHAFETYHINTVK